MREVKDVVENMLGQIPPDINDDDSISFKETLENVIGSGYNFVAPEVRWERFGTEVSEALNSFIDSKHNIPDWFVECLSIFTVRDEDVIKAQLEEAGKVVD